MGSWFQAPCPRCGIVRETLPEKRRNICRDCSYTLTKEEKALWAA